MSEPITLKEMRVDHNACSCPSQFVCDHPTLFIGWECDRGCGLTADAECDYGGWHKREQALYVNATRVRLLLGGSV